MGRNPKYLCLRDLEFDQIGLPEFDQIGVRQL